MPNFKGLNLEQEFLGFRSIYFLVKMLECQTSKLSMFVKWNFFMILLNLGLSWVDIWVSLEKFGCYPGKIHDFCRMGSIWVSKGGDITDFRLFCVKFHSSMVSVRELNISGDIWVLSDFRHYTQNWYNSKKAENYFWDWLQRITL